MKTVSASTFIEVETDMSIIENKRINQELIE
jgi:hypothetical protein